MSDLNQLLDRLLQSRLPLVLVGGYAGVVYGCTQVTRDIGLCMPLDPQIIGKLRNLLSDLHAIHRQTPQKLSFLEHPSDLANVKNLYLQTDFGPLDILSEIIGVGAYPVVAARAVSISLFGETLKVIHVDDLIRSKSAMGRERDLATVRELEAIKARSR